MWLDLRWRILHLERQILVIVASNDHSETHDREILGGKSRPRSFLWHNRSLQRHPWVRDDSTLIAKLDDHLAKRAYLSTDPGNKEEREAF